MDYVSMTSGGNHLQEAASKKSPKYNKIITHFYSEEHFAFLFIQNDVGQETIYKPLNSLLAFERMIQEEVCKVSIANCHCVQNGYINIVCIGHTF